MQDAIDRDGLDAAALLMASRRSIRRYREEAIAPEVVEELLRCAANAPSAHNRQPWRFAVLRRQEPKVRLANAMGERLRADRLRDGDSPAAVEADVARSFERISCAPVVVLVATSRAGMDAYPDAARGEAEKTVKAAEAYRASKVGNATGDASRFASRHTAHAGAAEITETRLYLEAVERVLARVKKFIISPELKGSNLDFWLVGQGATLPPFIPTAPSGSSKP